MKGTSLISIEDLTQDDILEILDRAAEFEKNMVVQKTIETIFC